MTGTQILRRFALALALAALPAAALATANAQQEIKTAAEHAGFAAASKSIQMVHAHMHHALNCLVGPKGEGYDAGQIDPCKNSGAGAIPDSTNAAAIAKLKTVVAALEAGVKDNTLASAKATAAKAQTDLDAIK